MKKFPKSIDVILGNKCSLACPVCPYHGANYPAYFDSNLAIEPEVMSAITRDLPGHDVLAKFGQYEEPLLYYPQFKELAEHFLTHGVSVHLTTNGELFNDRIMPLLRKLTSIFVSIDAATSETYRKVRGGNLDVVKRNLDALLQGEHGEVSVSFIRQPNNRGEEQAFQEYWMSKGIRKVYFYALFDFNSEGYVIKDPFISMPQKRFMCELPLTECFVYPNGDVQLCCHTLNLTGRQNTPIMGNVKHESLESIWNGAHYTEYRKALRAENWSVASVCKDCTLWATGHHEISWEGDVRVVRNHITELKQRL